MYIVQNTRIHMVFFGCNHLDKIRFLVDEFTECSVDGRKLILFEQILKITFFLPFCLTPKKFQNAQLNLSALLLNFNGNKLAAITSTHRFQTAIIFE